MKVGAEPKKVAILAVLLITALVLAIRNFSSAPDDEAVYQPPATRAAPVAETGRTATPNRTATPANRSSRAQNTREFRPSLKPKAGEEQPDPMTIDPTLRLDRLAKVQAVNIDGTHRNIFEFGQPPAPKPDPEKLAAAKPKVPSPLVEEAKKAEEDAKPEKPKPPPIPLKFYGYVSPSDQPIKRAFFIEGEDIHVVGEGDLVKRRYKIVRIGVNSVVVEDTQFPGSEQTLPLEEQQG